MRRPHSHPTRMAPSPSCSPTFPSPTSPPPRTRPHAGRQAAHIPTALLQAHPKLLLQFQDPGQADQLTRIMSELEQTKVVLHDTIEAALERGQKIDTCCPASQGLAGPAPQPTSIPTSSPPNHNSA